jgi:stress-induced morphogen
MKLEKVKLMIENKIPGSKAEILDPRQDGKHLKAVVIFSGFEGKTLIEQHRMVLDAIKDDLGKDKIHALSIETRAV